MVMAERATTYWREFFMVMIELTLPMKSLHLPVRANLTECAAITIPLIRKLKPISSKLQNRQCEKFFKNKLTWLTYFLTVSIVKLLAIRIPLESFSSSVQKIKERYLIIKSIQCEVHAKQLRIKFSRSVWVELLYVELLFVAIPRI